LVTNASVTLNGGFSANTFASVYGGFILAQEGSYLTLNDFTIQSSDAITGGAFFIQISSTLVANNLIIQQSKSNFAGCFFISSSSYFNCSECLIQSCMVIKNNTLKTITEARDTEILFSLNSKVFIQKSTFIGQGTLFQVGFHLKGSVFTMDLKSVIEKITINAVSNTLIQCSGNSKIIGSVWGAVKLTDSNLKTSYCTISDHLGDLGGAVFAQGNSIINILLNTAIYNNYASINGGAFYLIDNSQLLIGSGSTIYNNIAAGYGGVFFIDSIKNSSITGNNVIIKSNQALNSDLGYLNKNGFGYINFNLSGNNDIEGSIFVKGSITAKSIISNNNQSKIKYYGEPSSLQIINPNDFLNLSLPLQNNIPSIKVHSLDYFGNPSLFDFKNIVIMNLNSYFSNATLIGELSKAAIFTNNGTVIFDKVKISNKSPGLYKIEVSAYSGTLNRLNNDPWPLLEFTYKECDKSLERFYNGQCLSTTKVNSSARYMFGILGVLCNITALLAVIHLCKAGYFASGQSKRFYFVIPTLLGSISNKKLYNNIH
jgi:hypothetical protein